MNLKCKFALFAFALALCSVTQIPAFSNPMLPASSPVRSLIADKPADKDDKGGPSFTGNASWYGPPFHGRKTASGEIFDMNKLSAAHKTLPFPTKVMVENPKNGQSCVIRVTDRGPFVRGRVLDLSREAAKRLGTFPGVGYVEATVLPAAKPAPKDKK